MREINYNNNNNNFAEEAPLAISVMAAVDLPFPYEVIINLGLAILVQLCSLPPLHFFFFINAEYQQQKINYFLIHSIII